MSSMSEAALLRSQLEELRQDYALLVHKISHDLGAAARHVCLGVEMLDEALEEDDQETVEQSVSILQRAGRRLSYQLDCLTELSRIGRMADGPVDSRPAETLICDAIEDLGLGRDSIILQAGLPRVGGHPKRFFELWKHLLDNTRLHAGESPQVHISASPAGERVRFRIVDDGPGFPKNLGADIFRPLVSGLGAGAQTHVGAGLALVKRIVEVEGGAISIDDEEHEHGGAALVFTWPAAAA